MLALEPRDRLRRRLGARARRRRVLALALDELGHHPDRLLLHPQRRLAHAAQPLPTHTHAAAAAADGLVEPRELRLRGAHHRVELRRL